MSTATATVRPGTLAYIDIKNLHPRPENIRDEVDGSDLVPSIKELGILQPLNVSVREEGGYWVNAGHRRLDGAKKAKLTEVPCLIQVASGADEIVGQVITTMLVENLQRQDLTETEEGAGYKALVDAGWSQAQIARTTGVSASVISRRLKIMVLPVELLVQIDEGKLPLDKAEALADYAAAIEGDENYDLALKAAAAMNLYQLERTTQTALMKRAAGKLQAAIEKAGYTFVPDNMVTFPNGAVSEVILDGADTGFRWEATLGPCPMTPNLRKEMDEANADLADGETPWTEATWLAEYEDEPLVVGTKPLELEEAINRDDVDGFTLGFNGGKACIVAIHKQAVEVDAKGKAKVPAPPGQTADDKRKAEEAARRKKERAEKAHDLEQTQQMVAGKLSRPQTIDFLIETFLAHMGQDAKKAAAKYLQLDPVKDQVSDKMTNYAGAFDKAVEEATVPAAQTRVLMAAVLGTEKAWNPLDTRNARLVAINKALGYVKHNPKSAA